MLLVLAHAGDRAAQALVERWRGRGALLMVPRDLSTAGWRHHVGTSGEEWLVAEATRVRGADVRGVVVRLPSVREPDLGHIAREDRTYVATEMTAFLVAWLSALACPVLNRPSPLSLLGPSASLERWWLAAARAGMRLPSQKWQTPMAPSTPPRAQVSVVAERWFGAVAPALGDQALRLARAVGVEQLTAGFDGVAAGAAFIGAEPIVDPGLPGVADALLERIERARA